MNWRLFGALGGAVATAGVLFALAAPGHTNSILDPVAEAATTTASTGSADFTLAGSVTANGKRIPLNGNGSVDLGKQRARMSMSLPIPGLGSTTTDAIVDHSSVYVHTPLPIPGIKPWLKAELPGEIQAQPADVLKTLDKVGNSRKLGTETVAGARTTHYRATIDPGRLVSRAKLAGSGLSSIPVDVWIDDAGRVRRESIRFSAAGLAADLTLTLTHFGGTVDATPPAADQVTDASGLLGKIS